MTHLLDTSTCIQIIRRRTPETLRQLTSMTPDEVGISSITAAELWYGVHRSAQPESNRRALDQFLLPLAIYEFDAIAAAAYGEVRAFLEAKGTPIGPQDTLIASHALALGATLVTANTGEFERVPGLAVVNW